MSNRRERRRILRRMGLLSEVKPKKNTLENSIEDGKNKHRQHLQRVKNDLIKKEKEKSIKSENSDDFFFYRNQNNEYSSLKSILLNRDWSNFESEDSDAE
jgi:hypothetical protein